MGLGLLGDRRARRRRCGWTRARPSTSGRERCRARSSSTMKPCWASWRRWYDVAPVLRPSRAGQEVAVAGPSMRSSPSIRSRTGWPRALRPAASGVTDGVSSSMRARLQPQRDVCKQNSVKIPFASRGVARARTGYDARDDASVVRRIRAPSNGTWTTSPTGSPGTVAARSTGRSRASCGRSSPAATGWWPRRPARGRAGPSSCASLLGLEGCCPSACPARSTTSAAGPSTATPAASTRCSASTGSARPTSPATRLRQGHHRAGDGRRPVRRGGHQRLPLDHPRPVLRVDRAPPRPTRPTCGPTTSATRWRR